MIHPASAGEERKQNWSSGIVIFHQEKGGRPHRGSEPKSSALRSEPIFRTARTALAKPTSSSQHQGPNGSGTKAHDRNPEVGVCPCALQAQKGTGPVRKSTCRSQSQHFAIRSFLREVRRAKPLMSWRRLYLRKSAKLRFRMCYILSIERELLRHSQLPKSRQGKHQLKERRLQKCF